MVAETADISYLLTLCPRVWWLAHNLLVCCVQGLGKKRGLAHVLIQYFVSESCMIEVQPQVQQQVLVVLSAGS